MGQTEKEIGWHIQWFPLDEDSLVGEQDVNGVTIELAEMIVGVEYPALFAGLFTVDAEMAERLRPFTSLDFDLEKYEYQFGAFQK